MRDDSQSDDSLYRRMADAVLASPDTQRHRAMEAELADHPELLREYRRLRTVWAELETLPPGVPPRGARERAEAALRKAVAPAGGEGGRAAGGGSIGGRSAPSPMPRRRRRALEAVAALVVFLAGAVVGAWADSGEPAPSPGPAGPGSVFALLIRGGDVPDDPSGAREAMAGWAGELGANGRLIWAGELAPDRGVLVAPDSTPAGTGDTLGGIFLVRARDRNTALRLARDAPHLAWGGSVEVVPVMEGR